MASIFDNATAIATRGDSAPFVRETYNALADGSTFVALLSRDASDEYAAEVADADEVIEGTALVIRSAEYDAETLRVKINARNSDSKRHAKVTFGAVSVSNYLQDENGNRVGIVVSSV